MLYGILNATRSASPSTALPCLDPSILHSRKVVRAVDHIFFCPTRKQFNMPENGASTPLPPGGGLPPEPQVQDPAARKIGARVLPPISRPARPAYPPARRGDECARTRMERSERLRVYPRRGARPSCLGRGAARARPGNPAHM